MDSILYAPLVLAGIMLISYQRNHHRWLLKWALLLTAATLFLIAVRSGYVHKYQPPTRLLANGCTEQHRGYVKTMYC